VDNVQVPALQVGDAWLVPVLGKGAVSVTILSDAPATVSLSVALPEPANRIKELQELIAAAKKEADAANAASKADNERAELEKRYEEKIKEATA
jgi:hypothetical protein